MTLFLVIYTEISHIS